MNEIIEVKVRNAGKRKEVSGLYEARQVVADISACGKKIDADVTLIIQAYNQIDKTKRCIESVLKYTEGINYEMLLIDNGSEPEVLEYFKSIEYDKKTIIHVDNNIGAAFPNEIISLNMLSRYVVFMACDLIVTSNWLQNMLRVIESDCRIGMVNPVCSNVSNFQEVKLEYSTYEEMQEKARMYNVSDPKKWQERMRIITLGSMFRKECLYAMGWPVGDMGFLHDFMDDDMAFKIRRVGYKVVLAGDTWICHDHEQSERDVDKLVASLEAGRANFVQKYHDIDAWNDACNNLPKILINKIKRVDVDKATILGIDVKCGQPILDIKNYIRKYEIYDAECSAFTRDEKYTVDLKTICDGHVICDREEFLTRKLPFGYYDYIIIDKSINAYYEPINVLLDAYMLLKQGGQLIFSLKNTNNAIALLQMMGKNMQAEKEYYYNYPMDALFKDLKGMNLNVNFLTHCSTYNLSEEVLKFAKEITSQYCPSELTCEMYQRMIADKIYFSIEK